MNLEKEIKNIEKEINRTKLEHKLAKWPLFVYTPLGFGAGYASKEVAKFWNIQTSALEQEIEQNIINFRDRERKINQFTTPLKNAYETVYGKAQEILGMRDRITDTTDTDTTKTLVLRPIESIPGYIDFNPVKLPDAYASYPLLGLTIGFVYGLLKAKSKLNKTKRELSRLFREKEFILRMGG